MLSNNSTSDNYCLLGYCRLSIAALTLGIIIFISSIAVAEVRIVNGYQATTADNWPWIVQLQGLNQFGYQVFCTGTLIAPEWILTAAHCIKSNYGTYNYLPYQISANIGATNIYQTGKPKRVSEIIPHPEYYGCDDNPTYCPGSIYTRNDIALLRLETPSQQTPLSTAFGAIEGQMARAIGYGNLGIDYPRKLDQNGQIIQEPNPDSELRYVDIPIMSDNDCITYFSSNINVPQQAFCAGTGIGLGGVASGDSGGPLVLWDSTQGKYGQVGIAMRSNLENLASYTRVMNYVPWIREQLSSPQSQPQPFTVPRNDTFTPLDNGMQRRRLDFSWPMQEPRQIPDSPYLFYPWNGITTPGYGNEPVLPWFVYEVGYDYPLQGVVFLGGHYTIVDATPPPQSMFYSPFFIANSRTTRKPSTDEFDAPNWYPSTFFSQEAIINAAGKPDLLTATAGQYNPNLGQQRIFTGIDFDLYYSDAEDKIGPLACVTKNNLDGTTATIEVEANDASDIKTAVVAYTDGQGSWRSVELTANGDKLTGSFTANASTEFFVQTVDGTGNVGVNDADGKYFKVGGKLPTCQLEFTPAACHLYGVNDKGRNHSQFFTVAPDTLEVKNLGPTYQAHDIEALAMRLQSGELYAAAGDDTDKKGHLYQVDKENGQILDLGSTPCKEVDALAFHPDGTLWAWGQDCGLFRLDNPLAPETAKLVISSNGEVEVEDMTWNTAGTIFYGVENLHGGQDPDSHGAPEDSADKDLDFDEGVRLLAYNVNSGTLNTLCDDFMGSLKEVEAMETLPDDSLILGFHGSNNLTFGVLNMQTCQMTIKQKLTTSHNDIEGIALPTKACGN